MFLLNWLYKSKKEGHKFYSILYIVIIITNYFPIIFEKRYTYLERSLKYLFGLAMFFYFYLTNYD